MTCADCKNKGTDLCSVCCTYQGGVPDHWEAQPATMGDWLRGLGDEALSEWITGVIFECMRDFILLAERDGQLAPGCYVDRSPEEKEAVVGELKKAWLRWLTSPFEEDEDDE